MEELDQPRPSPPLPPASNPPLPSPHTSQQPSPLLLEYELREPQGRRSHRRLSSPSFLEREVARPALRGVPKARRVVESRIDGLARKHRAKSSAVEKEELKSKRRREGRDSQQLEPHVLA